VRACRTRGPRGETRPISHHLGAAHPAPPVSRWSRARAGIRYGALSPRRTGRDARRPGPRWRRHRWPRCR
jgi:hypothetical protein